MKNEFIGFYEPTEKEIDQTWTSGIFVFDTNMLHHLYRYTELTRRDFFLVLDKIKERLYLPYQVALEFHSNRRTVIMNLDSPFRECDKIYSDLIHKTLKEKLSNFQRHPSIDMEPLEKLTKEYLQRIEAELINQKQDKPDFSKKDEVRDRLVQIFDGKMGKDFDEKELSTIFKEGGTRYEKKIPPGYMDRDEKSSARKIYGDYIIWKDLIGYSKREKKNIIFVTADLKEDWWLYDSAGKIPRPELIKEFTEQTGQTILIYDAEDFLKMAKERSLVSEVSENSIEEVKEIRLTEENNLENERLRNILVHHHNKVYYDTTRMNLDNFKKSLDHLSSFSSSEMQDALKAATNMDEVLKIAELMKYNVRAPSSEELNALRTSMINTQNFIDWYKANKERFVKGNNSDTNQTENN